MAVIGPATAYQQPLKSQNRLRAPRAREACAVYQSSNHSVPHPTPNLHFAALAADKSESQARNRKPPGLAAERPPLRYCSAPASRVPPTQSQSIPVCSRAVGGSGDGDFDLVIALSCPIYRLGGMLRLHRQLA